LREKERAVVHDIDNSETNNSPVEGDNHCTLSHKTTFKSFMVNKEGEY
jgi:hypothetical protein